MAHIVFPYMFVEATYCKARVNHRVLSQAVGIATESPWTAAREILGHPSKSTGMRLRLSS